MIFTSSGSTQANRKAFQIKSNMKKLLPGLLLPLLGLLLLAACTNTDQRVPFTTRLEPIATSPMVPTETRALLVEPTSIIEQPNTLRMPSEGVPTVVPNLSVPTASPTTPPAPVTRIAVIGDFGSGDTNAQKVADLVINWQPDFILTVGDNNYPSGSPETIDQNIGQFYHQYIHPYRGQYGAGAEQMRFFPTLGNHDWDTEKAKAYFDYFDLPGNERYYDVILGPIHVFALDSDSREPDGVGRKSTQAEWLKEKLGQSSSPWKIVVSHHPPYSSGPREPVAWIRWPFAEWGATALLTGHDHFYERLIVDGFPILINGLGGGAIYSFGETHPGSQVRYNETYGALFITAVENLLTFEFYEVSGTLIDKYQLQRQ